MLEPWILPGFRPRGEWHHGATAIGTGFRTPLLRRRDASAIAGAVEEAVSESRRTRTLEDVIRAVDRAVTRLTAPDGPREAALDMLETELGWDAGLAGRTLDGFAAAASGEQLLRLVRSELGDEQLLEGFRGDAEWAGPGARRRRAIGPRLMLLVLAGNVPGVSVTAAIRALLVRSGALCKLPRTEPGLLPLFARLLAEEDEVLGRTLAATWWPAGVSSEARDQWSERAELAVVYGGDDAVSAVRRSVGGHVPVVAYGPRLGVAVVLSDASDEFAALARDVCAYDQQGCVSPRLVFVVGASARPSVRRLAEALEAETARHPPPAPSESEATAIRAIRADWEFGGYGGEARGVETPGKSLRWTVLVSDVPEIRAESLPRMVVVSPVADVDALETALRPLTGRVQSIGYAGRRELEALAEAAARLGVSRVAPFGSIAWPPPDWRHEGRHQLLPLLRWTDLEVPP